MNTIMNMDPWSFLDDMFDVGGHVLRDIRARATGHFPPVNVYLDDNAMVVDLELPGKTAEDVDLTLEPQAVVVSDKPKADESEKKDAPAAVKAPAWSRRIELPFRVDAAKANAKFVNGILRVELPRIENEGIKKIAIA